MRQALRMSLTTMIVLASSLAAQSRAGIIQNHGAVRASGVIVGAAPSETLTSATNQAVGAGAATTGVVSVESHYSDYDFNNHTYAVPQDLGGQAEAHTRTEAAHLLAASASALGQPAAYGPPFTSAPRGGEIFANADAAWTDIAFVNGPQRPDFLFLTFSVSGLLTANPGQILGHDNGLYSESRIGISWQNQVADFSKEPSSRISFGLDGGAAQVGETSSLPPSWTITDGVLGGTSTIRLAYDSKLGGYGFAIALGTDVAAEPGNFAAFAFSQFSDTLALTSVTGPDGRPVAVTFDSGLTLAAVPEPSSLAMICLGLLGAAGWARSRPGRGR